MSKQHAHREIRSCNITHGEDLLPGTIQTSSYFSRNSVVPLAHYWWCFHGALRLTALCSSVCLLVHIKINKPAKEETETIERLYPQLIIRGARAWEQIDCGSWAGVPWGLSNRHGSKVRKQGSLLRRPTSALPLPDRVREGRRVWRAAQRCPFCCDLPASRRTSGSSCPARINTRQLVTSPELNIH